MNNDLYINFENYINNEINFSYKQVCKILNHYNINRFEDFYYYNNNNCLFQENNCLFSRKY